MRMTSQVSVFAVIIGITALAQACSVKKPGEGALDPGGDGGMSIAGEAEYLAAVQNHADARQIERNLMARDCTLDWAAYDAAVGQQFVDVDERIGVVFVPGHCSAGSTTLAAAFVGDDLVPFAVFAMYGTSPTELRALAVEGGAVTESAMEDLLGRILNAQADATGASSAALVAGRAEAIAGPVYCSDNVFAVLQLFHASSHHCTADDCQDCQDAILTAVNTMRAVGMAEMAAGTVAGLGLTGLCALAAAGIITGVACIPLLWAAMVAAVQAGIGAALAIAADLLEDEFGIHDYCTSRNWCVADHECTFDPDTCGVGANCQRKTDGPPADVGWISCICADGQVKSRVGGTCHGCGDFNGDPGGCGAYPGCAYYGCSGQCHPMGTSDCAAGCSDRC